MSVTKVHEKDFENWNDQMAQRFNPDAFITQSGFVIRWVQARRIQEAIRALQCEDPHSVLDLGCGAGNITVQLKGQRIVGVDLSQFLLDIAEKRTPSSDRISYVKANIENIPFPDSSFDRAICSEVMEHVQNPDKVIAEMHRVCKPGARVVITVPNEDLINRTKKIILKLGLRKWIAGGYAMSTNMLDEWHQSEIEDNWVLEASKDVFDLEGMRTAPFPLLPYHRIYSFLVKK